ncbi:hypothetical protein B0H12DRAFT_1221583 [Mycena haematopus]|nr:hypothetical protein B0H12DRAFT_1221583 [Mycena haematopus]
MYKGTLPPSASPNPTRTQLPIAHSLMTPQKVADHFKGNRPSSSEVNRLGSGWPAGERSKTPTCAPSPSDKVHRKKMGIGIQDNKEKKTQETRHTYAYPAPAKKRVKGGAAHLSLRLSCVSHCHSPAPMNLSVVCSGVANAESACSRGGVAVAARELVRGGGLLVLLELLHPFYLQILLSVILKLDDEDVVRYSIILILSTRLPSRSFLLSLLAKDRAASVSCQLEASLASMSGRDSFVIARTGYGKTLCIAIPLLPQPNTMTITVSPLKQLQRMQVIDFMCKYGIPTLGINEDTPNSPELWQRVEAGEFRHLIVQPEQFRLNHGHLPRMAKLLHNRVFVAKIKRVAIDEAHNIYTAGTVINGRPPFRPSWGALSELRPRLSKDTSYQALSATIPSYIHRTIQQNRAFEPNTPTIRVSINRPNLVYAVHVLVDGRHNLHNLDCIIPQHFHPPMRLPQLVIFHGQKTETSTFAEHLNSRLPPAFQKLRICRHYHSDMSPEYLEETYNSFADAEGVGLDVPNINGVINQSSTTACRKEGRKEYYTARKRSR